MNEIEIHSFSMSSREGRLERIPSRSHQKREDEAMHLLFFCFSRHPHDSIQEIRPL